MCFNGPTFYFPLRTISGLGTVFYIFLCILADVDDFTAFVF